MIGASAEHHNGKSTHCAKTSDIKLMRLTDVRTDVHLCELMKATKRKQVKVSMQLKD